MTKREHKSQTKKLEAVLESFRVQGSIVRVSTGPVVTLYEFEPAPGIKASKVFGLADDIARAMSAVSCRASVIPGNTTIGIELPNPERSIVYLDKLFKETTFKEGKERLPWALGADIGGETVIVDIAKFPHLLMAGTTGSGKSVAMNTLIVSILKRMTADECKFIMIDPKQLELAVYTDIPHLLAPVVTDPEKAVNALQWAVEEMEQRYRKMAEIGVRNISGFNEVSERRIPYIVIVIDEVADLMMVAGKEVEKVVQRLAQMARAAGIHVIMATQRPSVDVITGTIKANFPTRISFAVTSKFDSRVILGEQGAEQLLGMGDMLLMSGGGRIRRVHGAFMSDEDVAKFVESIKAQGKPKYADAFIEEVKEAAYKATLPDEYQRAVDVVLLEGKATTSYIQRRLGTTYLHAQNLCQRMEREGVVGPADIGGRRIVLIPFD